MDSSEYPLPQLLPSLVNWCSQADSGVLLRIRVVPNANCDALVGVQEDGTLRIRIQSPPINGKANKALIRFLSKSLKIPARRIMIQSGEAGRVKSVLIEGIAPRDVQGLA